MWLNIAMAENSQEVKQNDLVANEKSLNFVLLNHERDGYSYLRNEMFYMRKLAYLHQRSFPKRAWCGAGACYPWNRVIET